MVDLTQATMERLAALFGRREMERAARILREECADNLPAWSPPTPEGLERIRFAVLKLSQGRVERLSQVVGEAQVDWRDVLVAAGFADDVKAHHQWFPSAD